MKSPPRFFSFRTDQDLLAYAGKLFEVIGLHVVDASDECRFQSLTLLRGLGGNRLA